MSRNGVTNFNWGFSSDDIPVDPHIGSSRRQENRSSKERRRLSLVYEFMDGGNPANRPAIHQPDQINNKLDRLLDGFSNLESRMDNTDRRVSNLEPLRRPDPDPPYEYQNYDDGNFDQSHRNRRSNRGLSYNRDEFQRQPRSGHPHQQFRPVYDQGYMDGPRNQGDRQPRAYTAPTRNPPQYMRDQPQFRTCWDPHGGRQQQDRAGEYYPQRQQSCWDPPGLRQDQFGPLQDQRYPQPGSCWDNPSLRTQFGTGTRTRHPTCWDPPQARQHSGWEMAASPRDQREWQKAYQPYTQRPYTDRHTYDWQQPPSPNPNMRWDSRSGSTHLPQQPRKLIDSVRSPSPAQLAAINDYNEKLRVYRLEQAALVAHVTAMCDENIVDDNLIAHTDNTSTMGLGEDVSNDDADVPNIVDPNNGATLEVPNGEPLEKIALEVIVKNDKESPQVLVESMADKNYHYGCSFLEVYDDKIQILTKYVACDKDVTLIQS